MIGSDHAIEGASDAFWSALWTAVVETSGGSHRDSTGLRSSLAPGGLYPLPSGASFTRPSDWPIEPNSATQPNPASGQRGRVETLNHPTQAGHSGSPALAEGPTPAGSFLSKPEDNECRGVSSDGAVPSAVGAIPLGRSSRTTPPTLSYQRSQERSASE